MIRVALVHDWLTGMRGGEYVLEAIAELFPEAELFTLLCIPEKISPKLAQLKRHTSSLQKIPGAQARYRYFLPWMPRLIEKFDLSQFDLVVSSSHCVAKGIRKSPNAVHISYVHAPMRHMWDRYNEYFGADRASLITRIAAKSFQSSLQKWDRNVSQSHRVDTLIANSQFIASQIQNHYGRSAQVIYPFADFNRFKLPKHQGEEYLMVTAFAPYKRVDLAIEAFNQLGLHLNIVGSGQEESRLKKLASSNIHFLGPVCNQAISELYSQCKAFIFPGVEDFGITLVESLASGTPVIAYQAGGATEILTEKTSVFFNEPTQKSLIQAIHTFEKSSSIFSEAECRLRASQFSKARFQSQFIEQVNASWLAAGKDQSQLDLIIQSPSI